MKWERGHVSQDVEDRRGTPARGGGALKIGGGGILVVALLAIVGQALGIDLSGLVGSGGGGGAPAGGPAGGGGPPPPMSAEDKELYDFINFTIDDIQDTFQAQFQKDGQSYRRARLVVFTDAVDSGCGTTSSAVGPFYCPPDERAYIDLSFYRELKSRFGAPGDFAQAYVLAHEIGHHLQKLLGIDERVRSQARRDNQNALSVRQELQADCFAGVWAHSTQHRLLEAGDVDEALGAATAIGDDRLQQKAGMDVNPETWTHGSSQQRVRWFKRGMESGQFATCDTFSAADL